MVTINGITATISDAGKLSVAASSAASGSVPLTVTATSQAASTVKGTAATTVNTVSPITRTFTPFQQYRYNPSNGLTYYDLNANITDGLILHKGDKITVTMTPDWNWTVRYAYIGANGGGVLPSQTVSNMVAGKPWTATWAWNVGDTSFTELNISGNPNTTPPNMSSCSYTIIPTGGGQ